MPTNLWGEEYDDPIVRLEDNKYLEKLSNQILNLTKRAPNLLNGDTIGEINRKVMIAVWLDNGLKQQIPDKDLRQAVIEWLKNTKVAISEENSSRAVRYLASRDLIRLPSKAVQEAERHRQRIARSVK
jgi:hypothetical protein